jgi:hypothetical protein
MRTPRRRARGSRDASRGVTMLGLDPGDELRAVPGSGPTQPQPFAAGPLAAADVGRLLVALLLLDPAVIDAAVARSDDLAAAAAGRGTEAVPGPFPRRMSFSRHVNPPLRHVVWKPQRLYWLIRLLSTILALLMSPRPSWST